MENTATHKMTQTAWNKGLTKNNNSSVKQISKAKLGSKNPNWKGNKVGYSALHLWLKRNNIVPKPKFCEKCGENKPFDLANKGIYDRNPKNWWWLCRKCHMESDGRTTKLKERRCEKCGKIREEGIRYLHGKKTCERCWYARIRKKKGADKISRGLEKPYNKTTGMYV